MNLGLTGKFRYCALDEGMGVMLIASVVRSKTEFNLGVTTLIKRTHHRIRMFEC